MGEIKISKVYNKINYKIYYGDHSCKYELLPWRGIERRDTIHFCHYLSFSYHILPYRFRFRTIALLTEIKIKQFRLLILLSKFIYSSKCDETLINKKMLWLKTMVDRNLLYIWLFTSI